VSGRTVVPRRALPGQRVSAEEVRFTQNSVDADAGEIAESMKASGWKGDPIDVVRMPDGKLTSVDNTRVAAARKAGIEVRANIHDYNEPLPNQQQIERFTTKKGVPKTWGNAVELRIGKQTGGFAKKYPMGSPDMPRIKPPKAPGP
jgi:hypothetical protein